MVKIIHDGIAFGKTGLAFFLSLLIWTLSIAATASNNLSLLKKDLYAGMGLFVFPTIGIAICFIAVYIEYVLQATRRAYQADSFKKKADALQSSVLRNQVDPHFLFNALNTIKSLYPVDKEKGDRAVDLLSKQLRALVEGKDVLLIPLQKELENIYSYVELENMKASCSFVVLFDIEAEDYEVPIFGVQTLLENAIRYSRVNEKEDGAISLKSYEEGTNYILEIEDNGVGFEVNAIEGGSTGIRNAKERFEHLLKASFSIESQIGVGTRIKIAIPKKERRKS